MYETSITIVGNVVGDPTIRNTPGGRQVTNFRLASTPRRFNRAAATYEDSDTLWMSVVCWTDLARNAAASLHKGDPVIVCGRLSSREYVKDENRRVNYEVTADAIGHNLARGTSAFMKVSRSIGLTSVPVGEDGMPEDMTDELLNMQMREHDERNSAFAGHVSDPSDVFGGAGADTYAGVGAGAEDAAESGGVAPLPNSGPLVPIG